MKAFKTFLRSPGGECSQKPSRVSNSSQDHLAGGTFEPGTWADLGLTTHDFKLFASPWGHGEKHRFTYIPKTKATAQGGQDVQCSHLTLSQCHGTCWQCLLAVPGTSFSACQVARSLKNIISLLPVPRRGLHDVDTMRGLDNSSLYSTVGPAKPWTVHPGGPPLLTHPQQGQVLGPEMSTYLQGVSPPSAGLEHC